MVLRAITLAFALSLLSCTSVPKQIPDKPVKLPTSAPPDTVSLDHGYFQIQYSKRHRLPALVHYVVTNVDLKGPGERRDNFHKDEKLTEFGVAPVGADDYPGKLYDRGHMAPAADFNRSQEAMDKTFVMSNMVPKKQY